jgi:hypothetical protein
MSWRIQLAKAAGLPPLELMEGYFFLDTLDSPVSLLMTGSEERAKNQIQRRILNYLPIKWECLKPSALHILLQHSDCEGSIEAKDCGSIADALGALLPNLPEENNDILYGGNQFHIPTLREKTQQFIDGLRLAASKNENVEFY